MLSTILPFVKSDIQATQHEHYVEFAIEKSAPALEANAYYFNHPDWAKEYLMYCHREDTFKSGWQAATGGWTNKIVVDIGCGPGNIFATLKGSPGIMIGVDIAPTSLEMAGELEYIPVLADAHNLPFESSFADIVILNAALHHCEDMRTVLTEAARIVKPGGLLITDHDPQLSAWNYKGLARILWRARLMLYRIIGHGFHKSGSQQYWGLQCEIHHKLGHGVTKKFFKQTLEPLGFTIKVYPHNHQLGSQVLLGEKGRAAFKFKLGNLLSGRNPRSDNSALSLMCVAVKD